MSLLRRFHSRANIIHISRCQCWSAFLVQGLRYNYFHLGVTHLKLGNNIGSLSTWYMAICTEQRIGFQKKVAVYILTLQQQHIYKYRKREREIFSFEQIETSITDPVFFFFKSFVFQEQQEFIKLTFWQIVSITNHLVLQRTLQQ